MNPPLAPLDQPVVVRHRSRFLRFVVVATLLALYWLLAVGSKRGESVTADELAHLTGGFTYWQFNDYRIQPENGNLPQRWGALPAWLDGASFPPLAGNDYWRTSDAWILGHQFFYETGEDHFPRLMAGRAMCALFGVAVGCLVFCWSRRLFGPVGALLSLGFFTFSPSFLAHGALITSDVCMAFFFLASVGAYWRHLHDPRARWWILSALVFGLACVAKYSAGLLLPMMAVMALVRAWSRAPLELAGRAWGTPRGKLGAIALSTLGHGLVAVLVIWGCYGFRYSAFNPALPGADHFIRPWETTLSHLGAQAGIVRRLMAWHILPEAYLYGYSFVIEMSQFRSGFLDGAYSLVGWVRFFPLAFLYKSTLPLLLAGGAAVGTGVARWRRGAGWAAVRGDLYRVTPLLALFGIYWLVSLATRLNIGHRHILPTYPVLFILAGILGRWLTLRRPVAALVVALLLAWQVREAVSIYPHYLAYFNPLAGGPANGHRHLVDSSLDWGQDLPGLKRWLGAHAHGEKIYLSYFGSGSPASEGIRVTRLADGNFDMRARELAPAMTGGIYCISATMFQQIFTLVRHGWTATHEHRYAELSHWAEGWRAGRDSTPREQAIGRLVELEHLRFGRLCAGLQRREPDDEIGYSILIFRLTDAEVRALLEGPPPFTP